ncbi:MAG: starch-binding protein [Ruminococcus sp.]|nr:starch-binding protein [Ruminococcus sp.]
MKTKAMKFISLVLIMAIIATCCVIVSISASASAGDVIYFDNSVTKFSTVYCYMWQKGGQGSWPGQPMTKLSGDIWAYTVTDNSHNMVIFHNNSGTQSKDIDCAGSGKLATPTSSGGSFDVNWTDYTGSETLPTQATQATQATQGTTSSSSGSAGTIYCQNDAEWSEVFCYMWNSKTDNNGWPGERMIDLGDGVWEYNYPKNYANVIFSQNGSNQTIDLNDWANNGNLYNNKTGTWDNYKKSPVKIKALNTSLESPSYTNCGITISAAAFSSESSSLNYKFTANNTVLSNGPSSSVAWIPTAAGTYKLDVEVTDGAGNSNNRSVNFEIRSADNLAEAYITGFVNSLGTSTQIKRGSAITFTTNAIGGQTGNYKLFYKFQITDPSGKNNTAYYTTNKTYSYTPSQLGTYTIKASVQNAYNNTVTKTYTYTSVDNITEHETTQPTQATQQTQPTQATQQTESTQTTQATESTQATQPTQATQAGPMRGDANNDSKVDVNDVTWIQLYLVNIEYYRTNLNTALADVTGDSKVKIQDANKIQQYIVGIINQL